MTRLTALALVAATAPAHPGPLTVPVGEAWRFTLDRVEPVHPQKTEASANLDRGSVQLFDSRHTTGGRC